MRLFQFYYTCSKLFFIKYVREMYISIIKDKIKVYFLLVYKQGNLGQKAEQQNYVHRSDCLMHAHSLICDCDL